MIEIEKKFTFDDTAKRRLLKGAKFVGEKKFTDVYYDSADYRLTSTDRWLRMRDGKLHLKVPFPGRSSQAVHQYRELTTDKEIADALSLGEQTSLAGALKAAGYLPVATFTTVRQSYKNGQFNIDLDDADLKGFRYRLGEIELMVAEPGEAKTASAKIVDFAKIHGLDPAPVHSKFITYLQQHIPTHYQALVDKGVIQPH